MCFRPSVRDRGQEEGGGGIFWGEMIDVQSFILHLRDQDSPKFGITQKQTDTRHTGNLFLGLKMYQNVNQFYIKSK